MMKKAKLEEAIQYKTDEIQEKQNEIDTFELDQSDYENQYDEMLDDSYEHIFNIYPSTILKNVIQSCIVVDLVIMLIV